MREIKFRLWDGKEMLYNDDDYFDINICKPFDSVYDDIMQYTSIKDINGKEIYEGDIVKTKDAVVEVVFNDDACFCIEVRKGVYDFLFYYRGGMEVIGNIYENPELAKGVE